MDNIYDGLNSISALMLPQRKSEELLKLCVWGELHDRRHVYMCATEHTLFSECGVHILLCISKAIRVKAVGHDQIVLRFGILSPQSLSPKNSLTLIIINRFQISPMETFGKTRTVVVNCSLKFSSVTFDT